MKNHSLEKIRLLIITNLFPNPQDPLRGVFVAHMVERLRKRCDITVISPLPWFPNILILNKLKQWQGFSLVPKEAVRNGMQVYYPKFFAVPKMGFLHSFFIFLSICSLVKSLKKQGKVDLINAHWVFPDGVAASWVARLLKIPFVISAHGCDINLYSSFKLRRFQIIRALKNSDKITVVSNAQKLKIRDFGLPDEKTVVIKNGVEFDSFNLKDKLHCRQRFGLDKDIKVILFVGQIIEVKGITYLFDAIIQLKSRYDNFKVFLIGDGNLKKKFEDVVSKNGLREKVVFLGQKSREEIPYWFGLSDVLCLPSIREGCPTVVLESLASGRPVVASRVGGIPELINESNGILFEPRNSDSLSKALHLALEKEWNDKQIQDTVGIYTWENIANTFSGIFQDVLKKPVTEKL